MRVEYRQKLEELLQEVENELATYCTCSLCENGDNNSSAIHLISQARKLGAWCCLTIQSDYAYSWQVELVCTSTVDTSEAGYQIFLINADGIYKSFLDEDAHGTTFRSFSEDLLLATCHVLRYAIEHELKSL